MGDEILDEKWVNRSNILLKTKTLIYLAEVLYFTNLDSLK